ncbi:MAG: Serine/threonine-protein kinase PrkC [bacterium ADurb.Bin429]|nr:MAG: Serine/threonine-protein kinase PrkC [bacterium ADurb.Bin429]
MGREHIHEAAWGESYPHPFVSCLMPLIAMLAVAAVGIFGVQLWQWSLPEDTQVPVVVGLKQEDAAVLLQRAGLRVEIYPYTQSSETIPSGSVISSDPTGGRRVKEGRIVQLIVSAGSAFTTVPDIRELSLVDAQARLRKAQLLIASETYVYDAKIPYDRVVSLSPPPGTKLQRNSTVTIKISKGRQIKEQDESLDDNLRSTTLNVELPMDAEKPEKVRIDVIDDIGRTTAYEREHNPGDTVVHTVQGSGKKVKVEVFFGEKLLLTREL